MNTTAPRSLPTVMGSLPGRLFHGLLRGALSLRYRVETQGLEEILRKPDPRPLLILPSHSALIDPFIMYSLLLPLHPRALADQRQVDIPVVRDLLKTLRPIVIPDVRRDGRGAGDAIRQGLQNAVDALRQGDHVLLYPSGRITRDGKDHVIGNSGAYNLYAALNGEGQSGEQAGEHNEGCRVVLARVRGLWGSRFSMGDTEKPRAGRGAASPLFGPLLLRGLRDLLCNGLFFMPRRPVRVVFEEVGMPPAEDGVMAFNTALENFYHAEAQPRVAVPRYFWQGTAAHALSEGAEQDGAGAGTAFDADADADAGPQKLRQAALRMAEEKPELAARVLDMVRQETGMDAVTLESNLSSDLGIDSLRLTGLALLLEEAGGHPVQRMDMLLTVGDCLLAAAGTLESFAPKCALPTPPDNWWPASDALLTMPEGRTVVDVFLQQMRRAPSRPSLAAPTGQPAAMLTRRDVLLRALALASWLRADPRTRDLGRVGIMLPASAAATVLWLATLLAGKTPVMLNWTAGEANVRHALRLTEAGCVLTARQLLQRLGQQGFDTARVGGEWIALEDVAATLGLGHKIRAALGTGLTLLGLPGLLPRLLPAVREGVQGGVPETAAILFTSGSETLPKAVPLTHANILANCRDVVQVLQLRESDTMLGMLPPFHSLGLTGNMGVALAMGMPLVFHPNPTESGRLNEICQIWRPSVMLSPPTFLEGMLVRAASERDALKGKGPLASLRVGFVGAEKCPDAVYSAFAAQTGGILCEGYGVTECAPGVCVNLPSDPRPGTIGVALPSVETALVLPLEGQPERRAEPGEMGETGMLLVRGPNVFDGYLAPPASYRAVDPTVPTPAQPFVEFEGRRWYRSGDLASADAGGHMTFRGRLGRFVKLGGEMLSLPQMESALLTAFECRRGALEGPLLAVECPVHAGDTPLVTLYSAVDITRDEANAALRAAGLPALLAVQRVHRMDAIPVLGSGKTDYRALKAIAVP